MSAEPPAPDIGTPIVQALVLYSLAEFQCGHCAAIRVEAKNLAFSVSDDGRGHAIDRIVSELPYLPFIYTHFDYPFAPNVGAATVQLQGIGMSLINRLCSELTVIVQKPDRTLSLLFENGALRDQRLRERCSSDTGNTASGVVSSQYSQGFDERALHAWLRRVKLSAPALALHFNGQEL